MPGDFIVCDEIVCDLNTLTIPVVKGEMDGYAFQCVHIDHRYSILYLGYRRIGSQLITRGIQWYICTMVYNSKQRDILTFPGPSSWKGSQAKLYVLLDVVSCMLASNPGTFSSSREDALVRH